MKVKLNPLCRWYTNSDYLEIFHPKYNNILYVESKNIDNIWKEILSNSERGNSISLKEDSVMTFLKSLIEMGIYEKIK